MYAIMKTYKKPIISVDSGLAEGVYAASGAGSGNNDNSVTVSELTKLSDWGNDNGQLTFTVDFSNTVNLSQLTLKVKFNHPIANAWGGGATVTVSGSEMSCTWYSAPSHADFTIQVDKGLSTVSITGYSCTNA